MHLLSAPSLPPLYPSLSIPESPKPTDATRFRSLISSRSRSRARSKTDWDSHKALAGSPAFPLRRHRRADGTRPTMQKHSHPSHASFLIPRLLFRGDSHARTACGDDSDDISATLMRTTARSSEAARQSSATAVVRRHRPYRTPAGEKTATSGARSLATAGLLDHQLFVS